MNRYTISPLSYVLDADNEDNKSRHKSKLVSTTSRLSSDVRLVSLQELQTSICQLKSTTSDRMILHLAFLGLNWL